jgi:hypothetical protein
MLGKAVGVIYSVLLSSVGTPIDRNASEALQNFRAKTGNAQRKPYWWRRE